MNRTLILCGKQTRRKKAQRCRVEERVKEANEEKNRKRINQKEIEEVIAFH